MVAAALGTAAVAGADPVTNPIEEGVREQSCKALAASTVGVHDKVPEDEGAGLPPTWAAAPRGLLPARVYLRTPTETFNRRYAFALRGAKVYAQSLTAGDRTWRQMPLPPCIDGRLKSLSLDDDEMIAIDAARRIYTMDNALKDATTFNWTSRWGTPFWTGPGYTLPDGIVAWSWSVVSPLEDVTYTDPAGNHQPIGDAKVSHIWALRRGGRRISFWDPWLPLDESYGICAPRRGRFRSVNLSASGSTIFVIGRRGDMFTRVYDFDLSGHDAFFDHYSYEDQRGKGNSAPFQLPPFGWVHQPKIPGPITSTISIHKVGKALVHRTMRVEGRDRPGGRTGYWEKDITQLAAGSWRFHETGRPLTGRPLRNARRDTSRRGLGRVRGLRYVSATAGLRAEVRRFDIHCSPARLRVRPPGGRPFTLILHAIDGLRQQPRASGLDDVPREFNGDIEVPKRLLGRPFIRSRLGGRRFTDVTVEVTTRELQVKELGWTFRRRKR